MAGTLRSNLEIPPPVARFLSLCLLLRRRLSGYDAAAVAATYGSVGAVTFVTATQILDQRGSPFGGHRAAAMALMESPPS